MTGHVQDEGALDRSQEFASVASSGEIHATVPCLVLEYQPYTLANWLADAGNAEMMGAEKWKSWAIELSESVAWCHGKGILHGDIKVNIVFERSLKGELS
jgi:hypothetical protein